MQYTGVSVSVQEGGIGTGLGIGTDLGMLTTGGLGIRIVRIKFVH